MLPYKSLIPLDRLERVPLYLQISNVFTKLILGNQLTANVKLPGERILASLLNVNRQTVIRAYAELESQGWIQIRPKIGVFVNKEIPLLKSRRLAPRLDNHHKDLAAFQFKTNAAILESPDFGKTSLEFNDGSPDYRLAPVKALGSAYRANMIRTNRKSIFTYSEALGTAILRKEFSSMMNDSRGLSVDMENIMITRGSQMGIYMIAQSVIKKGDNIIVGETNYYAANSTFEYFGASLQRVQVDSQGICIEQIEKICKRKPIRCVYVTPHHHYPTTVTLSAERRIQLLALANSYNFIVIEDDYDYDFHYKSNPIMPLASIDKFGKVIYVGSLSKSIAPAFRIGFLVAPKDYIASLGKIRSIIDRQGDNVLELAVAELMVNGDIRRHLRKTLLEYRKRRDYMSGLLASEFTEKIKFKIPDGGLAIWAEFERSVHLPKLADRCKKMDLFLSDGTIYDYKNKTYNACRMGFASMNYKEMDEAFDKLQQAMRRI